MHILVIDDERSPIMEHEYTIARTTQEAVNAFIGGVAHGIEWDEVYFDHDLGCEEDVWVVVKFLEQMYFTAPDYPVNIVIKKCIVHSQNPVGAQRLMTALGNMYPTVRGSIQVMA